MRCLPAGGCGRHGGAVPSDTEVVSEYAWEPTPERIAAANVTRLMKAAGAETIDELRRRSVADIDWFWDLVVRDLGLPFDEPYRAVRDSSGGIEWTTWFVGGRLNVADACVERWRADPTAATSPAVIHEDEAGNVSTLSYVELGAAVDACAAGLRAARDAGCDVVLPRSAFVEQLPVKLTEWMA